MIKKQKHGLKIIRRFGEDIWGILGIQDKPSSVLNFIYDSYQNTFKFRKLLKKARKFFFINKRKEKFLYKIVSNEKEFKRKRRTVKIDTYLNMLKLRRFYGSIGKYQFKKNFKSLFLAANTLSRSFAYFLESRLDVILYRSNFFKTIFAARQYINHKKVFVNGQLVTKPGYIVCVDDIVSLSNSVLLYKELKERLLLNRVLNNYPCYLEVNYRLGLIILTHMPFSNEVPYPFFIDIDSISSNFYK